MVTVTVYIRTGRTAHRMPTATATSSRRSRPISRPRATRRTSTTAQANAASGQEAAQPQGTGGMWAGMC